MQNSKADSTNSTAVKTFSRSPSKASLQSKRIQNVNLANSSPRDTSIGLKRCSNTSVVSRRADLDCDESPGKLKNKFTQPRMNRLTELRIKRLQSVQTSAANDEKTNSPAQRTKKKETIIVQPPTSLQSSEVGDFELTTCPPQPNAPPPPPSPPSPSANQPPPATCPTPACLPPEVETLRNKLANLQSEFMEKVTSLRLEGHNISCKLVTMVQDENCQLILQKEDRICLPNNIPVQSVSDLKCRCRKEFRGLLANLLEKFMPNVDNAKDCREQIRSTLQEEMDNKLGVINKELDKLCCAENTVDTSLVLRENNELRATIDNLKATNLKLEMDVVDFKKNKDELKKSLDVMHKKNKDLAIELADKNIAFVEQSVVEDDLRNEVKQLKKVNKIIQQRLKETDANREQAKASINEKIAELQKQLEQELADKELLKNRSEELSNGLAKRDHQLAELQQQIKELEQAKDWQDVQTDESSSHEADQRKINELQAKLAVNHSRLESMVQEEQQLRVELDKKQELLTKMELKVRRLEDTIEYHRQVLAVRGERINYLDREMKQRDQESSRKLNEVMSQASEKNTIITQITNELASTNEQFQNICTTLSMKQTKLHSQEHVIKLLEESNARSVKLHTKLGEKNALLKDELEHLRRTVKTLMLGSGVNEAEVSDILME